MLQQYTHIKFGASTQAIIDRANEIVRTYLDLGYRLTLRQLYYQFVARDWLPNEQRQYKRLGRIISDARLAGMIDWESIEDRGRSYVDLPTWSQPSDIIQAAAKQYRIDLWRDQSSRVEVWIEKEALVGIIAPTCQELRVPYFACKGYVSASAMWEAGAVRMRAHLDNNQRPIVLHLGDHDPSGIDMTRDIRERLALFAEADICVERLALTMPQIERYRPPPNPAKPADSRYLDYVGEYGDECWELDALEPSVLTTLIRDAVAFIRDDKTWRSSKRREDRDRRRLRKLADDG